MALEAINEIRRAEEKAKNLMDEATQKSKDMLKNANNMADMQYNKILDEANSTRLNIIEKAEKEAKEEAEPILNKGLSDIENIKNISDEKKNSAIKLIVERIVKIHGNS